MMRYSSLPAWANTNRWFGPYSSLSNGLLLSVLVIPYVVLSRGMEWYTRAAPWFHLPSCRRRDQVACQHGGRLWCKHWVQWSHSWFRCLGDVLNATCTCFDCELRVWTEGFLKRWFRRTDTHALYLGFEDWYYLLASKVFISSVSISKRNWTMHTAFRIASRQTNH